MVKQRDWSETARWDIGQAFTWFGSALQALCDTQGCDDFDYFVHGLRRAELSFIDARRSLGNAGRRL